MELVELTLSADLLLIKIGDREYQYNLDQIDIDYGATDRIIIRTASSQPLVQGDLNYPRAKDPWDSVCMLHIGASFDNTQLSTENFGRFSVSCISSHIDHLRLTPTPRL